MKSALVLYTHVVGLAVIRALGEKGVPIIALCYKNCEMGKYSKYVKDKIIVPDPGVEENNFIDFLLKLKTRFYKSLIIPTDDYTVVALSRNREVLKKYFIVGVESWEKCSLFINKSKTYEIAEELKIDYPKTYTPNSINELKHLLENNPIAFPLLLKPNQGHTFYDNFKQKMVKINNEESLLKNFEKMKNLGLNLLVQELIPGKDNQGVNYNGYFVNGKPVSEFTAKKVRIEPPFFGSPRVIKSERIPEIINPGRKLMNAVRYTGFACIEFKKDERDMQYKLMEVNCRNNLSGSLSVKCGINFPWIMYNHYMEKKLLSSYSFKENIYWIDISHDFRRFIISRKHENYTFKEYIKPYLTENIYAVFSLNDPIPFIMRIKYLLKLAMAKQPT